MKNNKLVGYTNILLIGIYLICSILFIFEKNYFSLLLGVFCLLCTIVLSKLNKKFNTLVTDNLYMVLAIFIFFASFLGSAYGFYDIPHYDDFLHVWSGFISCSVAYSIITNFHVLDLSKASHILLLCIFIFMFNMGVASMWEIVEYGLDHFLGTDTQAGGLTDTVMDMLDAFIGGIIMTSYLGLTLKNKIKSIKDKN